MRLEAWGLGLEASEGVHIKDSRVQKGYRSGFRGSQGGIWEGWTDHEILARTSMLIQHAGSQAEAWAADRYRAFRRAALAQSGMCHNPRWDRHRGGISNRLVDWLWVPFWARLSPQGAPIRGVTLLLIKYYTFNIPKILGECTPLAKVVRGVFGE